MGSTVTIPARQPRCDTSTRNRRRNFKLDVTDPDLLIPITEQTGVSKRHSSDSQPARSQPDSETIPNESFVSLPCSPSIGSSSAESTSTSGTDNSTSSLETLSESGSSQPSSNASSPETTSTSASSSWTASLELQEMDHSFNTLLAGMREKQGHVVMRT